jgi:glycosyltransferase involved in cell wall biosynthesis
VVAHAARAPRPPGRGAVAISEYVAGELAAAPAGTPIRVVYNIVDGERFRPGLAAPTDLGKVPGEVRFGVVGALTPLKGQDLFLRAAARVVRELPHARFVLVGGTPYRTEAGLGFAEALRREASALGLDGRVRFLGQRADAARVIASLDVLVQPNRGPEGLGRAVLEAMACGVAVVAVERWGLGEIVRDGETGLATPHLDVEALAARMRRLGTDAALRVRLGRAGRRWVTTHQPGPARPRVRERRRRGARAGGAHRAPPCSRHGASRPIAAGAGAEAWPGSGQSSRR